jgi:hypothetical protein
LCKSRQGFENVCVIEKVGARARGRGGVCPFAIGCSRDCVDRTSEAKAEASDAVAMARFHAEEVFGEKQPKPANIYGAKAYSRANRGWWSA